MLEPEETRILVDQLLDAKSPKWSRDDLYRKARLKKATVASWFKPGNKKKNHLKGDVLYSIAMALGTSVEYLLTGEEQRSISVTDEEERALCAIMHGLPREKRGYLLGIARVLKGDARMEKVAG